MGLKEDLGNLEEELKDLDSTLGGIAGKIKKELGDSIEELNGAVKKTANIFSNDLSRSIGRSNSSLNEQNKIILEIGKGNDATKKIQSELEKIQKERAVTLRKINNLKAEGVYFDEESIYDLEQNLDKQEEFLNQLDTINTEQIVNKGITGAIAKNLKEYVISFDKSGILSKILNKELTTTQKISLLLEASFLAIVKASLSSSDNIAMVAKNTGLSYDSSKLLQTEFAKTSYESEKLFITSKDLNKSFGELTKSTGLIADFGGDTLVSQSTLTKQLGLSAENASKLSTLSRIQGKNTEGILDNTVSTVSAMGAQNKVGIDVKGILEEVSQVSNSIAVSLGKNPVEIAKAATQAKLLGLSLSEVDSIASSLLDFESSISAELEAELLIGKDLNLEKMRLLALNNDLAGLGEELKNQEEIKLTFSTGNRIQQEAAAKAIGVSRDQLASMVLQQDLVALGAENFKNTYGEATYQQLQSQSASEKFASSLEKIQGIVGDISIAFAPILDGFASLVGFISESKVAAGALVGVLGALAAIQSVIAVRSLVTAFASIFNGSFMAGPFGLPIAIAGAAALGGLVAGASSMATADDMVSPPGYGDRILSTPKGSIALNNQDSIVAGTNLGGGGNNNKDIKETNQLLRQILSKQGTVKMDSTQVGTAFSMNTYQVQ